jgi:hypothetical protein
MPLAEELSQLAISSFSVLRPGAFYGMARSLSPGAGVIFDGVPYPFFDKPTGRYEIREGLALVLTHECDIDQSNVRALNSSFLIAPMILMSSFAQTFDAATARNLARDIATNQVHRLMFLPPPDSLLRVKEFPLGAFVYFNAITNSDVTLLSKARAVCALSEFGLEILDLRLKNHLFRPKDEQLPKTM